MNDLERITAALEQLKAAWISRPTVRLGVLLTTLAGDTGPLRFIEDSELGAALVRLTNSGGPLEADTRLLVHRRELKQRRFRELKVDLARYAQAKEGRFWVAGLDDVGRISSVGDVDVLADFEPDAIADEEAMRFACDLCRVHGLAEGVVYFANFFARSERVARYPRYWIDGRGK